MSSTDTFVVTDSSKLMQLASLRPLATIIGMDGHRPIVDYAPALCRSDGHQVRVRFFLDCDSEACRSIRSSGRALALFGGPSSYISPDWFGVEGYGPSWNYLAAEAEGSCEVLDRAASKTLLDELADVFERKLWPKEPWTSASLPPQVLEEMLGGLCGFDLLAERFEGVRKLSQNHRRAARHRAGEALALAGGDPAIAAMMMNDIS